MPDPGEPRSNPASPAPRRRAAGSVTTVAELFDPPEGPDELGRVAGYSVRKFLGEGGMGCVYLAEDVRRQRPVALKFLLPALARDETSAARFVREGRAAARVRHENVVAVYEVGDLHGLPFIAMEYLRGTTLQDFVKTKGRPSRRHAVRICKEVLAGLHAAHELGLVHRDAKPANIWLVPPAGRVRLIDFGLARQAETDTRLTSTGVVVGTPRYMSPEQARGEVVDRRSDLFSVGVVLYELVTGHVPFDGENPIAVMMSVAFDDPRPAGHWNPDVPAALESLLGRLLAKNPADRPPTALAAIEELEAALPEPHPASRPAPDPPESPHDRPPAAPPAPASPAPRSRAAPPPVPTPARARKPRPAPRRPRGGKRPSTASVVLGVVLAVAVVLMLALAAIMARSG